MTERPSAATAEMIEHLVDRFLAWKLPADFHPDAGISFKPDFNEHTAHPMKHEPTGTNLFDATQAEAMVRYMVEGMPALLPAGGEPVAWRARLEDANGPYWKLCTDEIAARLWSKIVEPLFATPPTGQSGVEALRDAVRQILNWYVYPDPDDGGRFTHVASFPHVERTSAIWRGWMALRDAHAALASPSPSERAAPVAGQEAGPYKPEKVAEIERLERGPRERVGMTADEALKYLNGDNSAPPPSAVAQIVAWLRVKWKRWPEIADAIEAGEWLGTPVPSQWQPIETVPRDETLVLLHFPAKPGVRNGGLIEGFWLAAEGSWETAAGRIDDDPDAWVPRPPASKEPKP